ncbi:ACCELERATED CELL DEATH 6-like [Olea europaea subsp. europaea]|uniref:ACCELERATED CELL DEATH 6-like n=1 Tax=Olea europaea subsp. europaea TaxID=158383 RepID=A0A8S0RN04_OLEEU|nr:ACCELERATED CELL DEATH 6-like [Olea europaea subsp. europaea]
MDPSLYKAVQEGNLNAIREKKELTSTTQLTPNKNTLLHDAAQFNNSKEYVSEILITNGSLLCEVNSDDEDLEAGGRDGALKNLLSWRNRNGDTALHEAIRNNCPSVVNLMIIEDPDIANIANNAMETPLFLTVVSNPIDKNSSTCIDDILRYCPSLDYHGPEGKTALRAVALYNWKGISEKLLEKHPTLMTEVDDFGRSALHYAALHRSNEVAEELLMANKSIACVVAGKDKNKTALHIATCEGNGAVMKELKANGAKLVASNAMILENSLLLMMKKHCPKNKRTVPTDIRKIGDTHMVVAALIITVAFATEFTIPGGYDGNDGPNKGLVTLSRKATFKAFIITDTLAMACSASAVFLHFFAAAEIDKRKLMNPYLATAMLVMVAMGVMVIAFMTGLYAVLEHSRELAIIECVICSFCFLVFYYPMKRAFRSVNYL